MVLETYFSPEHGEILERIACPCCGSEDAAPYRIAHDRLFGRPGRHSVVRCRACSLAYTNPRPTPESLGNHYPADYFCYEPPEALRGLKKLVLGGVIADLVRRRLGMLEAAIGRLLPGTRVCDVGCSYAELLGEIRAKRGSDVVGVDFNADMVAYGRKRGVPIVRGTLEDAAFEDASFDVVTMTEYLEHEGNPMRVLAECRRVVRPGGHLAIEVPLISTLTARLFGNFWSQLDLPRHLVFFTEETLANALGAVGFEVVAVRKAKGSAAMSLLHLLGYERIGRMTARDILFTILATIPLLPFLPFLNEFLFVVARRKEAPNELESVPPPALPAHVAERSNPAAASSPSATSNPWAG